MYIFKLTIGSVSFTDAAEANSSDEALVIVWDRLEKKLGMPIPESNRSARLIRVEEDEGVAWEAEDV